MGLVVTHTFVSAKPDSPDATLINPSNWNAIHAVVDTGRHLWVDDYNFPAIQPGGTLSVGSNNVILKPIPKGIVLGNKLYVSGGAGTAEAVPITGWNPATGQAIITCANTHSGAWTIKSASSGIQETFAYAHTLGGGLCYLSGNPYDLYATVNCYTGVGLEGQGRYSSIIYKHGDFGSSFLAIQINDLRFTAFQIQQTINYVPGTPGTATNLPTNGAHLDLRGVNGVYARFIRLQDGYKNVSITGGAEIFFEECQFAGMWDGRAGSPKATINQFAIEGDAVTYGQASFIKLYSCFFGGVSNGTPNTPTNYNGIGGLYGLVLLSVEDFEMVGGFLGGANADNIFIAPSGGVVLNVRFIGVRFDSAADSEVRFFPDGVHNCGDVTFSACQFNGELAGAEAIVCGSTGSGPPLINGLTIVNCNFFAYGNTPITLSDGVGIKISNNVISYYNTFNTGVGIQACAIFIANRCTKFDISNNTIGGGSIFQDYDGTNASNCRFGILVANFGTGNNGTINNNTTPNGTASIGTPSDLVFLKVSSISTFANLPPTPVQGAYATVTDSNTATWGANIAGGGANKVLAFFNGTAWTVAGK